MAAVGIGAIALSTRVNRLSIALKVLGSLVTLVSGAALIAFRNLHFTPLDYLGQKIDEYYQAYSTQVVAYEIGKAPEEIPQTNIQIFKGNSNRILVHLYGPNRKDHFFLAAKTDKSQLELFASVIHSKEGAPSFSTIASGEEKWEVDPKALQMKDGPKYSHLTLDGEWVPITRPLVSWLFSQLPTR